MIKLNGKIYIVYFFGLNVGIFYKLVFDISWRVGRDVYIYKW